MVREQGRGSIRGTVLDIRPATAIFLPFSLTISEINLARAFIYRHGLRRDSEFTAVHGRAVGWHVMHSIQADGQQMACERSRQKTELFDILAGHLAMLATAHDVCRIYRHF
jgi:hypothetical protein